MRDWEVEEPSNNENTVDGDNEGGNIQYNHFIEAALQKEDVEKEEE